MPSSAAWQFRGKGPAMTNTATRHGLRKAAAEKRDRHAQRTPLPPRPGQVQDAKDAIAESRPPAGSGRVARNGKVEEVRYGTMTQSELLGCARALGLNPRQSAAKGKLLSMLLEAEREFLATVNEERSERRSNAKVVSTLRSGRTAQTDRIDDAFSQPAAAAPRKVAPSNQESNKGVRKAAALAAEALGWEPTTTTSGDTTEIVLVRGIETVQITWNSGVFAYETAHYAAADRVIKIRNVSHAKQLLARTPQQAEADVKRVVANKTFRRRPAEAGPKRSMAFEPDALQDGELVERLLGKGITWTNRISNSTESAYVSRDPRKVRLTEFAGERVIHWCCPITGFRAARVAALVKVGAKVDLRTRMATPDEAPVKRTKKAA